VSNEFENDTLVSAHDGRQGSNGVSDRIRHNDALFDVPCQAAKIGLTTLKGFYYT
jgi:hypothetical protein